MITRAIQRISTMPQFLHAEDKILFNTPVDRWTKEGSTIAPITYSSGVFTIPNASLSDYLVCWMISIKTATVDDNLSNFFRCVMNYSSGGFVSENSSSFNITTTGIVAGYKILRVTLPVSTDLLQLWIRNNNFANTEYLATLKNSEAPFLSGLEIANASIFISSI